MTRTLPESWKRIKLGDVVQYGKAIKVEPDSLIPTDWILELDDIERDTTKLLARLTFAERKSKSTKNKFEAGDVLYGKLRPYLNKLIIAPESGFSTTEIIPLKPNANIDGKFLFYWLQHPEFLDYVAGVSHGLNMPRLGTDAAKQAPLVLAPLEEQIRIGIKLDNLVKALRGCLERLLPLYKALSNFRQSVLSIACSGELTEDWRLENGQSLESWQFKLAKDVCDKVQAGKTPKEGTIDHPGVPFLKVYNIVNQQIDFNYRAQYVREDLHQGVLAKSIGLPGDVLMNIVGPPLGKVAILPADFKEWAINQNVILFRPGPEISSKWLYYFLCSNHNIAEIENDMTGSAGQVFISSTQCRNFVFAIPPMEEQIQIVSEIDQLFEWAENVEQQVTSAIGRLKALIPLVIEKAYCGQL